MPLTEGPAVDFFALATDVPEWERPLDEIIAELTGYSNLTPEETEALLTPDEYGMLSPAQWRVRELLAAQRWYLLRNVWHWKSSGRYGGRSGAIEAYYSVAGLPKPMNGLSQVYGVIRHAVGADDADATEVTKEAALGLWREAWKLGAIEGISSKRAKRYATEIYLKTRGAVDLWPKPKPGNVPELVIVRR